MPANHSRWINFFLLALLLAVPNLAAVYVSQNVWDTATRTIPIYLIFLFGTLAWVQHPIWIVRFLLPFYFILPSETLYIVRYREPSDSHILGILFETNLAEAVSYLEWPIMVLAIGSGLVLVGLSWTVLSYLPEKINQHRGWSWVRIATLILPLCLAGYVWNDSLDLETVPSALVETKPRASFAQQHEELFVGEVNQIDELYGSSFPVGIPFRIWVFWKELSNLRQVSEKMQMAPPPSVKTKQALTPATVVLVIGESSRPDHWSLNGYSRNTTPALSAENSLVSFTNIVSPWPATRRAVPILLVGETEATHRASTNHPSIIQIFKAAGYSTAWISNQSPLGAYDSLITVHARQADQVVYTNGANYKKTGATDDALLAPFQSFLTKTEGKKFIVLHLLGSHKRYTDRYPSRFEIFRPTPRDGVDNDMTVVNAYDNSVAFTDYVLSEVIKLLKSDHNAPSLLLYISDHGQTLPVNGCQSSGHGWGNAADFRVSGLVWFSDAYIKNTPANFDLLQTRRHAPFYSPEVVHTLLDMAGLTYSGHKPDWSWTSPNWTAKNRWVESNPDFDRANWSGSCGELKN